MDRTKVKSEEKEEKIKKIEKKFKEKVLNWRKRFQWKYLLDKCLLLNAFTVSFQEEPIITEFLMSNQRVGESTSIFWKLFSNFSSFSHPLGN